MKYQHLFVWIYLVALACGIACCLVVLYWLVYPYKTLEVKNFSYTSPIHIDTPVVHPGDVLKYDIDYCKYLDAPSMVYKTLIDGQTIILVPKAGSAPIGCRNDESTATVIPDTINPGRYYLDVAIDYKVNPIRTIRVHYYTEYFQVVDEDTPSTSAPPANGASKLAPTAPVDIRHPTP